MQYRTLMMKYFFPLAAALLVLISLISCLDGPKSKEPYTITRIIDKDKLNPEVSREMRKVVVEEVVPTSKYVYALVSEEGRSFWIATGKKELKKGETYFYNESVLKTQFESKEHNRIFDTLYLVTTLIPEEHGNEMHGFSTASLGEEELLNLEKSLLDQDDSTAVFAGRIKIADLVDNPEKYEGKRVEFTGTCTKVNPGIMGRNWIHLQDGSTDDFDLVITSTESVEKGVEITIRGIVRLEVDFGSGYSYPILLENGKVVR